MKKVASCRSRKRRGGKPLSFLLSSPFLWKQELLTREKWKINCTFKCTFNCDAGGEVVMSGINSNVLPLPQTNKKPLPIKKGCHAPRNILCLLCAIVCGTYRMFQQRLTTYLEFSLILLPNTPTNYSRTPIYCIPVSGQ